MFVGKEEERSRASSRRRRAREKRARGSNETNPGPAKEKKEEATGQNSIHPAKNEKNSKPDCLHACYVCNKWISGVLNEIGYALVQVDEGEENAGFLAQHKQAVVAWMAVVLAVCFAVLVYVVYS